MPSSPGSRRPRWYWVPVRVLLITFIVTLLVLALSTFAGILGVLIAAKLHGVSPNFTIAYRRISFPTAAVAAVLTLLAASVSEVRHYRQARALASIERAG
jgi:hypothetical protein